MSRHVRIKVVQYMWGEENRSYDIVRKINERYCRRHGYEYVLDTHSPRPERSCHWEKIPAMIEALGDCDYLLFLDADAWFYGQEFRIEEILLPLIGERDILMAADCGSEVTRWNPSLPNTGVVFVRSSDSAGDMLRHWNSLSDEPQFRHLRYEKLHEQETLWLSLWQTERDRFALTREYYLMNGYRGLFIRHQMATPEMERMKVLKEYLWMKKNRPWNWAIGMITAERPKPTLARTLESFRGTGFEPPIVFYDSEKRGGIWNVHRTLSFLIETNPDAVAYAVIEDDVVFARNIKPYIEEKLWPRGDENGCICSLFTPSWYLSDNKTWWKSDQGERTYMSQFRIYHPTIARRLVEDIPKLTDHSSRERQVDHVISKWASENDVGIYFHSPSLVQHNGTGNGAYESKKGTNYKLGQSRDFVGETFLCNEINIERYKLRRPAKTSLSELEVFSDRLTKNFATTLAKELNDNNCDLDRLVIRLAKQVDMREVEKCVDIVRMTGKVLCVTARLDGEIEIDLNGLRTFVDEIESEGSDG